MLQAVLERFQSQHFLRERLLTFAAVLTLAACQPDIGDECTRSTDCSATGERLCDLTQPNGYCTVFNCEPDTCPEDSVCVAFGAELSTAPMCQSSTGTSPYQRTFCLATCESNDDCRPGYACVNMNDPTQNKWGALVVDSGSARVCAVSFSGKSAKETLDRSGNICDATGTAGAGGQASLPEVPLSMGGMSGASGAAGSSGIGGDGGQSGGGAAGQAGSAGDAGQGGAAGAFSSGGAAGSATGEGGAGGA